jgi:hypothetical protein
MFNSSCHSPERAACSMTSAVAIFHERSQCSDNARLRWEAEVVSELFHSTNGAAPPKSSNEDLSRNQARSLFILHEDTAGISTTVRGFTHLECRKPAIFIRTRRSAPSAGKLSSCESSNGLLVRQKTQLRTYHHEQNSMLDSGSGFERPSQVTLLMGLDDSKSRRNTRHVPC